MEMGVLGTGAPAAARGEEEGKALEGLECGAEALET